MGIVLFHAILSMLSYRACESNSRLSLSTAIKDRKHFQHRKEKSTGILVGIILVFFLCHVFRLSIQVKSFEIVFGELLLLIVDGGKQMSAASSEFFEKF